MDTEAIVRDYLARLGTAAASLNSERRSELIEELREHIDLAVAEAGNSDESTVLNVLERLGSPHEIVAAETGAVPSTVEARPPEQAGGPAVRRPQATPETRALLLLTLGAVLLPFIGPFVGLRYVWSSARWTTIQKGTATVSVVGLLFLPAFILLPLLTAGELTAIVSNFGPLILMIPVAGFLTAGYLAAVLYLEVSLVLRRDV
jgi:uncharacterized membrane protein